MRLIDVDALGVGRCNKDILPAAYCAGWNGLIGLIEKAPTIDAVPVVRCKDCIRRYDTDECPMCFLSEGKYYEYTNENGFCDRGERKEGADNG